MIARQRIIRGWLWAGVVLATLTACVTESPDGTYTRSDADYTEAARINTQLGIDYMRKGETDRALSKLQRAVEQGRVPSGALSRPARRSSLVVLGCQS